MSINSITQVKVIADKDKLYLAGIKDIIPQYKLVFWVDVEDRIDIAVNPIGRGKNKSGMYFYGSDGTFSYYYFKMNSGVEAFRKPWSVRPDVIYELTGIWTISVLVNTHRRKNVVLFMTPEVIKEYIPEGYTLAFIPAERNYNGDYWTVIRTSDYVMYRDKLVERKPVAY